MSFTPRTPDQDVRPQIEAAKDYLRSAGFQNVDDLVIAQTKAFEGLHTIVMTSNGERRILRLSYTWLSDNRPEEVAHWLDRKNIGRSLREDPDARAGLEIRGEGAIHFVALEF